MDEHLAPGFEPMPGYRLRKRLGTDVFFDLWRAEGPDGRARAIKCFPGYDILELRNHLERQQPIRHPNLQSPECWTVRNRCLYVVTDFTAYSLQDCFTTYQRKDFPGIPRDELLGYVEQIADALDCINLRHGLSHLNITPSNLMLLHDQAKVADLCRAGSVTPRYTAPEICHGVVSPHSDQYSLAIVYQEMLTGKRPLLSTDLRRILREHIEAPPDLSPLPRRERPVLARALAKNPADRYPSCTALVQAIQLWGGSGPVWLTSNIKEIAQAIAAENAYDQLPILGDALEEAGCTDADMLESCRQPDACVRGRWAVDLVLGQD